MCLGVCVCVCSSLGYAVGGRQMLLHAEQGRHMFQEYAEGKLLPVYHEKRAYLPYVLY